MTDQELAALDAETFAALPAKRKVEIQIELLKRGDLVAIENLGIKVMTGDEWAALDDGPDVIEVKRSAD
jgi:hypothetical protein